MLKLLNIVMISLMIFSISCSKRQINNEPRQDNNSTEKSEDMNQESREPNKNEITTGIEEKDEKKNDYFQIGIASWYGGKFHGRRTSNGEIYDMNKLTAAHKTLPFNTIVEVTNLENNKKVIVRINDRGPFIKNRIIDLSYKAAKRIGIDDLGTARVGLRIVKNKEIYTKSEYRLKDSNTDHGNKFRIQVGAFSIKENAINIIERLKVILPNIEFSIYNKKELFVVITKNLYNENNIKKIKNVLINYGIDYIIKKEIRSN